MPIKGGTAYADTGEVLVNTWDKDQKTRRPIEKKPITVGSGDNSVELTPHPTDTDPAGKCSRFYGAASWVRSGGVRNGWMRRRRGRAPHLRLEPLLAGRPGARPMWEEMGKHRRRGRDICLADRDTALVGERKGSSRSLLPYGELDS